MSDGIEFFISYSAADESWAEWIAWQLDQAGYSIRLQKWDFLPGNNFVIEMDKAAKSAQRTLLVLSTAAIESGFVGAEWAAAFRKDPTGAERAVIPVRVDRCDVEGLLGPIIYIDLVGTDGDEASRRLLAGLAPGRSKPFAAPDFPGATAEDVVPAASVPATPAQSRPSLTWTPVDGVAEPIYFRDLDPAGGRNFSTFEFHFVPVPSQSIPVTGLKTVAEALADQGRASGLFSRTAGIDLVADASVGAARTSDRRQDDTGLFVGRDGQRGAWLTLPHDMLGSILDESELAVRVERLIGVLFGLNLSLAPAYSPGARLAPIMMMSVGDAAQIGRRSSSSLGTSGRPSIDAALVDKIPGGSIAGNARELSRELIARIVGQLGR
jgi:hypothetical protein